MRVLGQKKLEGGAKRPPPSLYRVKGAREVWYLVQKYRCKTGGFIFKGNDLDDLEEKNVNWT